MDRRGFLKLAGCLLGGVVLEQAIPLGRVWSFPNNIVIQPATDISWLQEMSNITLEAVRDEIPKLFETDKLFYEQFKRPGYFFLSSEGAPEVVERFTVLEPVSYTKIFSHHSAHAA